ncbi:MAG: tetratricopeptide repeat protein [Synechococcales bacterium]|nr:tetratricopeptide repeat protein [Synechococcales bacterium]
MIGQLLANRYQVSEIREPGKIYLAIDTHRPGYPLCLVQRLKVQSANPQTFQIDKLILEQRVQAIARLGRYNQIPSLLTFFEDQQTLYLVEEQIEGHPLAQEFSGGGLPESQVIDLLLEILSIIVFMHRHDVILRGLRPENLMRRQVDNQLVLINLLVLPTKIRPHNSDGNPVNTAALYMPPEQLQGNPVFSSNLYSLGMIAIQALTGCTPEALTPMRSHWRETVQVSRELATIIDRLVQADPKQRYRTASEVLSILKGFKSSHKETLPLSSSDSSSLAQSPSPHPHNLNLQSLQESPIQVTPTAVPSLTLENSRLTPTMPPTATVVSELPPPPPPKLLQPQAPDAPPQLDPKRRSKWWFWLGGVVLAGLSLWGLWWSGLPQQAIADYYVQQGLRHSQRNSHLRAVNDYNRALQWSSQHIGAYYHRGFSYYQLGNWRNALNDFTQVTQLDPENSLAFFQRGNLRLSLGDPQGAVLDYDYALRLDQEASTYIKRGHAQTALGKAGGAMQDYSKAIELDPNLAAAYLSRCLTKSNLDDQPGAISDCTQAANINPNLVSAYQNRSLAQQRSGNLQQALADINLAIRLDGTEARSYYQRGLLRISLENWEGAITDFNTALQFKSDYAFAYYQRGLVRHKLNDEEGAIADLEAASQLCLDQGMTGCYRDAQFHLKPLRPASNAS